MNIHFDSIHINSIWANSGNFTGQNFQLNWKTQYKENSSLGNIAGDYNIIANNINIIYDNDVIDSPFSTNENSGEKKGKTDDR
ncbi:hypothetical protein ACQCT6_07630 [Cytobacillus gottheilii]|uniref:hypothetical protein n=1 Tax=Cytobacillus gottheilii TaxID=859144 RepID=UPI003CF92D1E